MINLCVSALLWMWMLIGIFFYPMSCFLSDLSRLLIINGSRLFIVRTELLIFGIDCHVSCPWSHHRPSHPVYPSLLRAIVPYWWLFWPDRWGGISAGLVSRICSASPLPVSVSREQPVCLARLGFLPIFPLCQTDEEGSREGESSGKLPRGEGGQQRKQEKYIFLSLLSPSKASVQFPLSVSLILLLSAPPSIPPASHFVLLSPKPLILLLLPHTHSLILNLSFSLYQPFFNCSRCTSLLPASSLFFLSIASEHATSQHNPFTHSRWLQHTLFSPFSHLFNIFSRLLLSLLSPRLPLFVPHPPPGLI